MTTTDYFLTCEVSIAVCLAAFFALLWLLRSNGPSLGLPFAYLSLLVVNHVPGAFVPLADHEFNAHLAAVSIGIELTAIGIVCFVIGVWYARLNTAEQRLAPQPSAQMALIREDKPFWVFCLISGWLFTFGLASLQHVPTLGAIIYNGGAICMLGNLLALRWTVKNRQHKSTFFWLICLAAYPGMILVTSGFLSYGATAGLVVLCALAVTARSYWRVAMVIVLTAYVGLSGFSNYFQARDNIRDAVWAGASLERRVTAISSIFTQWRFLTTDDQLALAGIDLRLNQNYFVGLAAQNLESGGVKYLYGQSISDAMLSLVPRALWPGKTVFGGSGDLIKKMTGLELSTSTSWGVGNVMEFYINFGLYSLVGGFLLLGWIIGRLDHRAALAETRGDRNTVILFALPAIALIQPIGSMVELVGSSAGAYLGALFWNWAWTHWQERRETSAAIPSSGAAPS